jgi:murein DD-endopeptidase MepM/ murein hydrolase activator NlpD
VSTERVGDIVDAGRGGAVRDVGPAGAAKGASTEQTRTQLARLAAEFESMLLLQMLKEMRKAGSWDDEEEHADGFGTQTMLEAIDVELASHLSKVQGLGLSKQMLAAFDATASAKADVSAGALAKAEASALRIAHDPDSDSLTMPDGVVTSGFGWRRDPFNGAATFHRGIDVRAAYGEEIQAAGPGRVVSAGTEGGYGETVVIEHAGGIRTRYAHLSAALVATGQEVAAGQVVGRAGQSGRATGTHLHFEVTTAAGDRLDPAVFSQFKLGRAVADLTVGTTLTQETRRHDDPN